MNLKSEQEKDNDKYDDDVDDQPVLARSRRRTLRRARPCRKSFGDSDGGRKIAIRHRDRSIHIERACSRQLAYKVTRKRESESCSCCETHVIKTKIKQSVKLKMILVKEERILAKMVRISVFKWFGAVSKAEATLFFTLKQASFLTIFCNLKVRVWIMAYWSLSHPR